VKKVVALIRVVTCTALARSVLLAVIGVNVPEVLQFPTMMSAFLRIAALPAVIG
jgi:hypothetical protein